MKDKRFFYFIILFIYMIGCIGGTAYLFYSKEWVFGVANIILVALSFPKAREIFKEFMS